MTTSAENSCVWIQFVNLLIHSFFYSFTICNSCEHKFSNISCENRIYIVSQYHFITL